MKILILGFFMIHLQAWAQGPDSQPPADISQQCRDFLPVLKSKGWTGAWVKAPLDWSHPTGKSASVFFYYKASTNLETRTPILFLNGGPAVSYQGLLEVMSAQLAKYDPKDQHVFVMMDQRGTGCSTPAIPVATSGPAVRRVELFSSRSMVRDAEVIRKAAFAGAQWKIFAQSFGGTVAARYLVEFPQAISSLHIYAPTYFASMAEFFRYRIIKQNEVLKSVLAYGKDPALVKALELAKNPDLCLPKTGNFDRVCGRVLLDGVIAGLGQGPGRVLGGTENWDAGIAAFRMLISGDLQDFISKAATPGLAFFRAPTIQPVLALWEEEFETYRGDVEKSCRVAYARLEKLGYHISSLPIDECRIVLQNVPQISKDLLKTNVRAGLYHVSQSDIVSALAKNRAIQFHLYTGEFDTLSSPASLRELGQSRFVKYTHFRHLGHAGWRFEPVVWKTLMGQ
jgi:pimeloyl-ACP methyl ester carboxylesterase